MNHLMQMTIQEMITTPRQQGQCGKKFKAHQHDVYIKMFMGKKWKRGTYFLRNNLLLQLLHASI